MVNIVHNIITLGTSIIIVLQTLMNTLVAISMGEEKNTNYNNEEINKLATKHYLLVLSLLT